MSNFDEKFNKLLENVEKFAQQEFALYGNALYCEEAKSKTRPMNNEQETSLFTEDFQSVPSLEDFRTQICNCMKCSLGKTRTQFVFGVGNPNADIMFIGEAPGADEDEQGEPFVGRAGQLLNKILAAIELKREEVYICNILKCRPPNNRDPLSSEVEQCLPYLWKQIDLVQPKIIMSLGRIAAQMLLNTKDSLTKLRASNLSYRGIPMLVTFHPAALLRNPNWKPLAWEDFKKLRAMHERGK
ncbi:MAG: uracil-DNA glycosylase [Ignavibacteria bacterium]|nr:uracil-DNA glycosylase [Ignavibacteria bacterium]